jgi:hypothetical protein
VALSLTKRAPGETAPKRRRGRIGRTQQARADGSRESIAEAYDAALHGRNLAGLAPGKQSEAFFPALTAATLAVGTKNSQDVRRLVQPWQARSMSYHDLVPEVSFATQFMSQMLRKVRLFPALEDPDTHEIEELDSGPVFDDFQRIQDRSGGREELQGSYAKLRFLLGESYLTVSPDEDLGEIWECLSPHELRVQPHGLASRFRAPMLPADWYEIGNDPEIVKKNGGVVGPAFADTGPDIILVWRLWRPHPAYTFLANCSMQAQVESGVLEELVLSTYSVRAQLKSRLYQAGILAIPDEISFTNLGNDPEEDPNSDVFQSILNEAISTAISDPGSAAALTPIAVRMAGEFIDKIKLVKFNDNQGELAEIQQRSEMVERFGVGVELPPDLFRAMGDVNHWTGWLVDRQTWDGYGYPVALEMAQDFNAAYLQPTARANNFADWQKVRIGIDPSGVIYHPDRSKDADTLFQARAISKSVYRESKGYNDNDAMPQNEMDEVAGIQIRDGSLYKNGLPTVRGGVIEPAPGEIENAAGSTSTTPKDVSGASTEEAPATGAPGSGRTDEGDQGAALVSSAESREQRILGAADLAVLRARELAGSRLRAWTSERGPKDKRCAECQEAIRSVPNWDVAAALGEEHVRAAFAEQMLLDGAGQGFAALLEQQGISAEWASELGQLVEKHALLTLFQSPPEPLPPAFASLLSRLDEPPVKP